MSGADAGQDQDEERLAAHGVVRLEAPNPGPMTLSGTNTWVVGTDPAYVVDPGPASPEHVERLVELLRGRGGLGGIALTHDHDDHSGAVELLRERLPAPVAAARGAADVAIAEGASFGPLRAIATPGHAPDHFAFTAGEVCFTGDAVLGEGYVFLVPEPGALSGYLDGLRRLLALSPAVLLPGHGPPIWQPEAKLQDYLAHRLHREQLLVAALADGRRSVDQLLDAAWHDVPAQMRPVAAITLAAHLDKLAEEGRLPEGVERPG